MSTTTKRRDRSRVRLRSRLRPRLRLGLRGRRARLGPRTLLVLVALAALLTGAFFWVRGSSLVAVQDVRVTGVSGPDATAIRQSLVRTAEGMSTLDVDGKRLNATVARYPFVRSLTLHTHLPHGLTIAVSERIPVAELSAAGTRTVVAADGELLRSYHPATALPSITVAAIPADGRVTGETANIVSLLAAAPYRLLARVATVSDVAQHGLTVTLGDGPIVYFGDASQAGAKWRALVTVLASSSSAGARYIDVTDPARPAAGTGSDVSPGAVTGDSAGSAATTSVASQGSTSTTG